MDAFSRGKMELGEDLMRHVGFVTEWVTPPQRSYDLLDLALSTWRVLTAEERETARSRLNTSLSGPSPYVALRLADERGARRYNNGSFLRTGLGAGGRAVAVA